MRFFAIIQIDESNNLNFMDVNPDATGFIQLGDYRVKAELDLKKDARLEVENIKTGEYLLYGPSDGAVRFQERKFSHSTLLIDKNGIQKESVDRHPLMAPKL